jgi:hypothetical protein
MYVYTVFGKWSGGAKERGLDYFTNEWLPMQGKACERFGVKFLRWVLPMGVSEDHVYSYETDLEPQDFLISKERYLGSKPSYCGSVLGPK